MMCKKDQFNNAFTLDEPCFTCKEFLEAIDHVGWNEVIKYVSSDLFRRVYCHGYKPNTEQFWTCLWNELHTSCVWFVWHVSAEKKVSFESVDFYIEN